MTQKQPSMDVLLNGMLADRRQKFARAAMANNALLNHIGLVPVRKPTRRERLAAAIQRLRERVGFWIAGHTPDDY